MRSATRGWLAPYLTLAVLWGCSFLFIATALRSFAPAQVAFGRIVVGFLLLAAVLLVRRERPRLARSRWGDMVLVGTVMTAIPFVLFALAEQRVSSVLAGLVNATTPLWTAVFVAILLPQERPDRVQLVGLLVGFAGIAVLLGVWDAGAIDLAGALMALGATFCYGLGNAWSRRRLTGTGLSPVGVPAMQLAVGTVVTLPFAMSVPLAGPIEPAPALALLALGLGGTGLAYVLYWRVLEVAGATVTASVTYVIPLVSTTLGVLVLHEGLSWYEPVGGAIVLAGVALTQWGAARRRRAGVACPRLIVRATPTARTRASPRERQVRDPARRGHHLDLVLLLQPLEPVPEPDAPAEQDRDLDDVQVVDEPRGQELPQHRRTATDPDVKPAGGLPGDGERLRRLGLEEVERRAAVHLERRAWAVRQHVGGCVERRVLAPPAPPLRVVLPPRRPELAGAHDLRADAGAVTLCERVVDAHAARDVGRLDEPHLVPEAGGEHPLVEPLPRVTERGLGGQALARGEPVERDREVVHPGA